MADWRKGLRKQRRKSDPCSAPGPLDWNEAPRLGPFSQGKESAEPTRTTLLPDHSSDTQGPETLMCRVYVGRLPRFTLQGEACLGCRLSVGDYMELGWPCGTLKAPLSPGEAGDGKGGEAGRGWGVQVGELRGPASLHCPVQNSRKPENSQFEPGFPDP